MTTPNVYTRCWFTTFLGRIDAAVVEREVAFLSSVLPGPGSRVLDLCCGPGRHAIPLAESGFRVTGLDRDAAALRDAASHGTTATFVRADMRRIPLATGGVDAVICMWQSFGHFDVAGNRAVLAEMARAVRPNGCVILDVYHREFHAAHLGERTLDRSGDHIRERRSMDGDRLRVHLRYESTAIEEKFEWQLYTPSELVTVALDVGLELRLACAEFDAPTPASAEYARMQIVFGRTGTG